MSRRGASLSKRTLSKSVIWTCSFAMRAGVAAALLICSLCPASAQMPDTASLAEHLKAVRGYLDFPEDQYKQTQHELLDLIDIRLQSGARVEAINDELGKLGLFWSETTAADPC